MKTSEAQHSSKQFCSIDYSGILLRLVFFKDWHSKWYWNTPKRTSEYEDFRWRWVVPDSTVELAVYWKESNLQNSFWIVFNKKSELFHCLHFKIKNLSNELSVAFYEDFMKTSVWTLVKFRGLTLFQAAENVWNGLRSDKRSSQAISGTSQAVSIHLNSVRTGSKTFG